MLGKDLVKEGWLDFANKKELEKEITQKELDMLVYDSYKQAVMYCEKNRVNKNLTKRFEKLNNRTKNIKSIKNISILRNVKMEKRCEDFNNTYLVLEDEKGIALLLDVKRGYDESFQFNRSMSLCQNSKIETLFESVNSSSNINIDIGFIKNVTYYENAMLMNTFSNVEVSSPFVLQISDQHGTTIFVDVVSRIVFVDRGNYKVKMTNKTNTVNVFKYNQETALRNKLLSHIKLRLLDFLCEWRDEE